MSVLASHRNESKVEYIKVACEICHASIAFLTRMSARYSRLLAQPAANLAIEVMIYAEKANSFYPSDEDRLRLRNEHLLKARAALDSLDLMLSLCYEIMIQNPQGCFTNSKGATIPPSEAKMKLDSAVQRIGELIDRERKMLTNVLVSKKNNKKANKK